MSMKKYALVMATAFFMCSSILVAQPKGQQRMNNQNKELKQDGMRISPEKRAEMMAKQLELTDSERAKVQALFEKQAEKKQVQREERRNDRVQRKNQFEADRKTQDAELTKIIGNEKFQKLQTLRLERSQKMNKRNNTSNTRERRVQEPTNANNKQ